jgi:hypothetical protein
MPTSEATMLAMMTIFVLDDSEPVTITLHEATPSSDPGGQFPVAVTGDFDLVVLPTSSYFQGQTQPNCVINGSGVVATEALTMDQVKSLYR